LRRFNAQTQVRLPPPGLATREFHYAQPARRHLQLSHRIAGIELAEPLEASVVDGIDIAAGWQAIASARWLPASRHNPKAPACDPPPQFRRLSLRAQV